ncbi:beta-1,3-galactosyl-O-glycosyl-glycoprotein beta-1,6-N-acetylglucosaminyltransferase-like [Ptychodera flava]|uniref:beta-1,3-galactosyl-O-glycosyl-glycoprotein beta-1,6-N-acetylglucosaminyltransferase-like n=1 Tax=Ptychodera flava TaxID=63121 RepID=UPI00396A101B
MFGFYTLFQSLFDDINIGDTVVHRKQTLCAELIRGRVQNSTAVDNLVAFARKRILSDQAMSEMAAGCDKFVRTSEYLGRPVTDEEKDFPLAFSIMVHTSAYQVELLLRAIYRPHNVYCIHVDRKAPPALHFAMQAIVDCFSNVFIASRLYDVYWGSINLVYAERQCQRDLLQSDNQWKYVVNLAGSEFPLKTNLEIVRILKAFDNRNDVVTSAKKFPERTEFRYLTINQKIKKTSQRKTEPVPGGITIHKGGLQTALTRQFVEFLHHSKIARDFLVWLNDTGIPDETYYQSLASLPEAPGGPGENGSEAMVARAKLWRGMPSCQGKFVHDVCIFTWRDLPWITRQPHLFVNKFNIHYDGLALECLSELLRDRTYQPIELNIRYYQKFAKTRSWKAFDESETWRSN